MSDEVNEENQAVEAAFKPGDKVVVNGGAIGEILVYDVPTDVLVILSRAGSSTDRATYHLSQTRLEHLVSEQVTSDERPAGAEPTEQPELPLEPEAPVKGSK